MNERPSPTASCVVVVPTFNERDNIRPLVERVLTELPQACVLIADDASPDGTGDEADALAGEHPGRVRVLHRDKKEGLGAAYVAAFTHALEQWPEAEFFIQMDADFSHDPAYLPDMLQAARDADLVVGSRYTQGISIVNWPLHRLIISKLGTAYARLLTGLPITDCTSGFKCYRAGTLRAMDLQGIRSNGYVFQVETSFRAWRLGHRLKDFPIVFYERRVGESKLHLNIALEAVIVVAGLGLERLLGGRAKARREI